MSRTKFSNVALSIFASLALLLAACGTEDGDNIAAISVDDAVAGLEAYVDGVTLSDITITPVAGISFDAANNGAGVKIALLVDDLSASGKLATIEGASAVSITKTVPAVSMALSSQAISIAGLAVSASMADYELADATMDGTVDIFDAVAINANSNGASDNPTEQILSDMNGDNAINNVDVAAALSKIVNVGTNGLDASLVVKPNVVTMAQGGSAVLLTFNAGTAPLNISAANITGATALAMANQVSGQSAAFEVSASASGPVVVDGGVAGQRTVTATVTDGTGNQGGTDRLGYIDANGDFQMIDPNDVGPGKTYEPADFIFKSWLEDEANPSVANLGIIPNGGVLGLNRTRPSADEQEERAPPFTQNLAAGYVFLRQNGQILPVVGAEVRWTVDDADCWDMPAGVYTAPAATDGPEVTNGNCDSDPNTFEYMREGSIIITATDDNSDFNTNKFAKTYTNEYDDAGIGITPFPAASARYPLHNVTNVASPNRNGFTWITLFSGDITARQRVIAVAYVGGAEIDKAILTKEFALEDCPVNVTVTKFVDTEFRGDPDGVETAGRQTLALPGDTVEFRIQIRGETPESARPCKNTAVDITTVTDRLKRDQVNGVGGLVDETSDFYHLVDNGTATSMASEVITELYFNNNLINVNNIIPIDDPLNGDVESTEEFDEQNGFAGFLPNNPRRDPPFGNVDYEGFDIKNISNLAVGHNDTVEIVFQAVADRPDTYCNSVYVNDETDPNTLSEDQITENPFVDRACFEVVRPMLRLEKYHTPTIDDVAVAKGQSETFRIVVKNVGPTPVQDVVIIDDLFTINGVASTDPLGVYDVLPQPGGRAAAISGSGYTGCSSSTVNADTNGFEVTCDEIDINGIVYIDFIVRSNDFGSYCDLAQITVPNNLVVIDTDPIGTSVLDPDACLVLYNLEIVKTHHRLGADGKTAGERIQANDNIKLGDMYVSRIAVRNRSSIEIPNVYISDLIGQLQNSEPDDFGTVVEYISSTCNVGPEQKDGPTRRNVYNGGVYMDADNLDTHPIISCPNPFANLDDDTLITPMPSGYTLNAGGGQVIVDIVSRAPSTFTAGQYCNTAKWEVRDVNTGAVLAEDTDEKCLDVAESIAPFTGMIDIIEADGGDNVQPDDTFPINQPFDIVAWIGNECSSTEAFRTASVADGVGWFFNLFKGSTTFTLQDIALVEYEGDRSNNSPVRFSTHDGSATFNIDTKPLVQNADYQFEPVAGGTQGQFNLFIDEDLEPCNAFRAVFTVSVSQAGSRQSDYEFVGFGVDSGDRVVDDELRNPQASETTVVQ